MIFLSFDFIYNDVITIIIKFSVVGIATSLRAGRSGFESRQGQELFLFSKMSRIQWVPRFFPRGKAAGV
jgi:hypothetical protein